MGEAGSGVATVTGFAGESRYGPCTHGPYPNTGDPRPAQATALGAGLATPPECLTARSLSLITDTGFRGIRVCHVHSKRRRPIGQAFGAGSGDPRPAHVQSAGTTGGGVRRPAPSACTKRGNHGRRGKVT